jgi:ABC-type lipoprotein export system ATPase subunit
MDDVFIEWQTASENNNESFTIERSSDGKTFIEIYTVSGAGSTTALNNYSYLDKDNQPGLIYYRLKQTDFNGTSTYSAIRSINSNKLDFGFTIFPNPSSIDNLKIRIASKKIETIILQITDNLGQIVYRGSFQSIGSTITLNIKEFCQLQSGIFYTMTIISEGKTVSKKIAIE